MKTTKHGSRIPVCKLDDSLQGSICESNHNPESSGVILPSAVTLVVSTIESPDPLKMIPPRCAKYHAVW
jgi:hypothetical protein